MTCKLSHVIAGRKPLPKEVLETFVCCIEIIGLNGGGDADELFWAGERSAAGERTPKPLPEMNV
jgi:hypothetical protein